MDRRELLHLDGNEYHEPSFVYAISPTNPTILDNTWTHQTTEGNVQIELRWFRLDHLEAVNFQPAFLKPLLQNPPQTPKHTIIREPHQKQADS